VSVKGTYNLRLRDRTDSVAIVRLLVNGKSKSKVTFSKPHIDNTGWQTAEVKNLYFQAGTNTLRVYAESGILELNYLQSTTSQNAAHKPRVK